MPLVGVFSTNECSISQPNTNTTKDFLSVKPSWYLVQKIGWETQTHKEGSSFSQCHFLRTNYLYSETIVNAAGTAVINWRLRMVGRILHVRRAHWWSTVFGVQRLAWTTTKKSFLLGCQPSLTLPRKAWWGWGHQETDSILRGAL